MNDLTTLKNINSSLRFIFWGILVCAVDLKLGEFDIINDFVGMLMILRGVVTLSRVPLSDRYRRWMFFTVAVAVLMTIYTFLSSILHPLHIIQTPKPNMIICAVFLFVILVAVLGVIAFCRCMIEHCSAMRWERAIASWKFSTRLVTYGVMLPCIMLAIALAVAFPSLEFFPKFPRVGSRGQGYALIGDDCKFTARKNGEVFYTETVSRSPDGMFHFKHPNVSPSSIGSTTITEEMLHFKHPGLSSSSSKHTINFFDWIAPVKWTESKVALSWLVLIGLGCFWAIIHVLMSLSRTVRETDRAITTSRGDETRDDVSNS